MAFLPGWRSRSHRRRVLRVEEAAADWWDPDSEGLSVWAAYQPKGAANFAASLLDLSGLGNNAGDPGGASTPGWDAVNGWVWVPFSTDYLTTTFVPQNDNSQSVLAQFTGGTDTNDFLFGVTSNLWNSYIEPLDASSTRAMYYHGSWATKLPQLAAGNLGIAGQKAYRNGIDEAITLAPAAAVPTHPIWIGCRNNGGAVANVFVGNIQALALYDTALTAGQVSAIATAMAAL